MLLITSTIQLENYIASHPKVFVIYLRHDLTYNSTVDSLIDGMEAAYTSVDVVKCHVDLLTPTKLATGIKRRHVLKG